MLLQIVALIALELGVHVLHKLPYVGPFAHPIMHFLTVSRTLDSDGYMHSDWEESGLIRPCCCRSWP